MYLKRSTKKATGRTHLSAVHNYHENGVSRTRTIKTFGYLDELQKLYEDPIAYCLGEIYALEAERASKEGHVTFSKSKAKKISKREVTRKNIGYLVLSSVYHSFRLDRLMTNRARKHDFAFSADKALQLLVFSRILDPASKRHDFFGQGGFFEHFDLSKDDIYRALSFVATEKDAVLKLLDSHMRKDFKRKGGLSYYDVTNYYFEIDDEDTFRRRGGSKEHRPNPIEQMGLLMDDNGFPVTYSLHPGNTHDSATLIDELTRCKRAFDTGRIVVVADKGINCSENIIACAAKGDGYIFSSTIRGATEEMRAWATSDTGWERRPAKREGDEPYRLK